MAVLSALTAFTIGFGVGCLVTYLGVRIILWQLRAEMRRPGWWTDDDRN